MESKAQAILKKVRNNNDGLYTLASIIKFVGFLSLICGIGCVIAGIYMGWNSLYIGLCLGGGINCLCFAGIINAINDIRVYSIAKFEREYYTEGETKSAALQQETKETDNKNHKFQVGDIVSRKGRSGQLRVVAINGDEIACRGGLLSDISTYQASDLEFYKG